MNYLLDTHAVIWALEGDERLGSTARRILSGCQPRESAISDMTLLEIAMLVDKKRIGIALPLSRYLQEVQQKFQVLPINGEIAAGAFAHDFENGDPFDRVIVATCRHHQLQLISRDKNIAGSGLCGTIW